MALTVQPITTRSAVQQCLRVRLPTGRAFNQPKFCPYGKAGFRSVNRWFD